MKHLGLCAFMLGAAALTGCSDSGSDASLTVVNRSDFVITELYLTDVGSSTWGQNLLRGAPLVPDERITLGVDCGSYDALLIDEDNVQCELHDLDLCLNDAQWLLTNTTCDAFTAAATARAAAAAAAAAAAGPTTGPAR